MGNCDGLQHTSCVTNTWATNTSPRIAPLVHYQVGWQGSQRYMLRQRRRVALSMAIRLHGYNYSTRVSNTGAGGCLSQALPGMPPQQVTIGTVAPLNRHIAMSLPAVVPRSIHVCWPSALLLRGTLTPFPMKVCNRTRHLHTALGRAPMCTLITPGCTCAQKLAMGAEIRSPWACAAHYADIKGAMCRC